MTLKKDVVIVGAGPAGLATAIQLNRYDISCVVVEKNSIGGLLKNANRIENYLGFPEGIAGKALIELIKKQFTKNNIQINFEEAINLDYLNGRFLITSETDHVESEIAVIATGTKPKNITNTVIEKKTNSRIFYEVYDIQDAESKDIAIIGAGDAAFDYALNLSEQNNVTIFNRKDEVKCLPVLKRTVEKDLKIQYLKNRILEMVKFVNDKLELKFSHKKNSESYLFDYLLIAIGREPSLNY